MKIRVFILDKLEQNSQIVLDQQNSHHLRNVLRVAVGDECFVFNTHQGEFLCLVIIISKTEVTLQIISKVRSAEDDVFTITLFCPIVKKEAMLNIVRQSVELGIRRIIPFFSQHSSVNKIDIQKIQIYANEALEQSNGILPLIINNPVMFADVLKIKKNPVFFANEQDAKLTKRMTKFEDIKFKLDNFLESYQENLTCNKKDEISGSISGIAVDVSKNFDHKMEYEKFVIVGPEGGFSSEEIISMKNRDNFFAISLGERILRADTACCVMLQLIKNFS